MATCSLLPISTADGKQPFPTECSKLQHSRGEFEFAQISAGDSTWELGTKRAQEKNFKNGQERHFWEHVWQGEFWLPQQSILLPSHRYALKPQLTLVI